MCFGTDFVAFKNDFCLINKIRQNGIEVNS